jgi:hypothetical protein
MADSHFSTSPSKQWIYKMSATVYVRALNDDLRRNLLGGLARMTPGVAALGPDFIQRAIDAMAAFDDFHNGNDPYKQHDLGILDVDGQKIIFKICCYDKSLTLHSPDPSDPNVTERVITLMLAEEY